MVPMTRPSERADGQRGGVTAPLPAVLGWILALIAVFFCCSPAAASASHHRSAAAPAVHTHVPAPAVALVVADAPGERGSGSSCHGAADHSAPVVLPGPTAPLALPCARASAAVPTPPLTGSAAIRGPSDDGAGSVDHLRLQVQRV
ncbi:MULTISPECIES: hypothetical protein [unclassified Streptomyces]|uniref:hypothetical protein n=1 Tax=Streptomyces TaxID=1883 RepID=UPI0001C1D52D|nr:MULTISPECIES: hypothetical protein [unclassified Streptomyces]AEN13617.1 conserved hypothetical protein [Streptomyces sp. SirexAA-E]MYR70612.1 hypothetical protein [Streptomyces sp. SID4939]MYS00678.1 hypothetical protein [Streptomyces sp. SID4940]MYT67510.1 hypothetical protein [Streptomyces sp. SID8357]MYT86354.1 hypothetical protein [Streptomyces sp. SID8360]